MLPVTELARKAKEASFKLGALSSEVKNNALSAMARGLRAHADEILQANALDLKTALPEVESGRMKKSLYERLKLTPEKLETTICGLEEMISLPDPVGKILLATELDDNLTLYKVSCPIGLLGVIFEARPDVVPQIAALTIKSGNAAILKGGKETLHTNTALMRVIKNALSSVPGYSADALNLIATREEAAQMLALDNYFDLIIPRGGNGLIAYVKANTKIPVLGHADGVCHIYVARTADLEMAKKICLDAKTQYPAACNAVETLLIDKHWPVAHTQELLNFLVQNGVLLYADDSFKDIISLAGSVDDFHTEYGEKKLSLKWVSDVSDAIVHINRYGSHHTDAILSHDEKEVQTFMSLVDSAGVYHNASTRFADGYRYGFGAEVGISTAKTHARGPVGLEGLTIYKYKLFGKGQIVADYVGKNAKAFTHKPLKEF